MSLGINLILLAIQVIGMILVFSVILQAKYSRYKQLAISTIVVGIEVAIAYVKLNVNVYTIMNNILIFCLNVIIILFLILGYKDKMWKKIIIYILVYMVNIIGEIASCKIYYQVFNREVVIAKNMVPVIYIQSTLITCFLLFMVCVAWKFFLYQNKRKIVYKCLIVSLILIQLFIHHFTTLSMITK